MLILRNGKIINSNQKVKININVNIKYYFLTHKEKQEKIKNYIMIQNLNKL